MEFLINVAATYGIAYFIADSFIYEIPREWISKKSKFLAELLHCNVCLSFWIGLILTGSILEALAIMGIVAIIKRV